MRVTTSDLDRGLAEVGVDGAVPVCVHSSVSSFGSLEGGAPALVDSLLATGTTILVPTFSADTYCVLPPPVHLRPAQNGLDYGSLAALDAGLTYSPDTPDIEAVMGAVPAEVLSRPGRVRGTHPLCSFTALGPLAHGLVGEDDAVDVYAPFRALCRAGGIVLLAGVGLNRMTLLHHAEEVAGRELFRRWARDRDGDIEMVRVGGCSEGFERLSPVLAPLARTAKVGSSRWRAFDAAAAVEAAAAEIRREPGVTHCDDPACVRCRDAVAGGPLLG